MKQIVSFILITGITAFLVSCSNDLADKEKNINSESGVQSTTEENFNNEINNESTIAFTYDGHEFSIHTYYEEFSDYIEKAEEQSDKLDELYIESVLDPFSMSAFGYKDGDRLLTEWGFDAPTRPEFLEKYLTFLIKNQDLINDLAVEVLKKSVKELPSGTDKSVYIFPANPDNANGLKAMDGVTGITWNHEVILIQIAPPFFEQDILKFTVAHEYQHTVFFEDNEVTVADSLLDYVLLEGKADTFARIIYPDIQPPWSEFASKEKEKETWEVFQENLTSTSPSMKDNFFLGNSSLGVPQWANYKIGNRIMDSFIKENPNVSIEKWTDMNSNEVLAKSKLE